MNELAAKIEAILFLTTRPVSFSKLSKMLQVKQAEIQSAVAELSSARNIGTSGIHIIVSDNAVELGTNPEFR